MNKKADRWEVRLGIAQVIILLGIVTGCMTLAFYLGFFSGKQAGFELAMESNAASSVKIPIASGHGDDASTLHKTEQAVTDVYARLSEKAKDEKAAVEKPQDIPELGSIKETEPSLEPPAVAKDAHDLGDPWQKKPATQNVEAQKVLGDDEPAVKAEAGAKNNQAAASLFDEAEVKQPALGKADVPAKKEELAKKSEPVKKEDPVVKEDLKKVEKKEEKKEAKKEDKKPTPAPTPVKNSLDTAGVTRGTVPGGWYAQVAAPTSKQDAESIATKLKSNGFHVAIENAEVRGDQYYRILVGPEKNKPQAEALVSQLRRESYIHGTPFIRMVK